jgi:hypothetical protein
MGGSSSKQATVVKSQPPSQNFHSVPTNSTAWNPSVNNQPTAIGRGLHGTVREGSQRNLPSQQQISELYTLRASTRKIAPQPPLEQKSNNAAPVLIRRQLPPPQGPTNTAYHAVAPVRVYEQLATPKPPEPKPRATVSPLHNANFLELEASITKMVAEQQKPLVAATSTSSSSPLATSINQVDRYLNEVGLNGAKTPKHVKRLRNSKPVGTPPARRAGLSAENSPGVASAGRKPMPPIYQGKMLPVPWHIQLV